MTGNFEVVISKDGTTPKEDGILAHSKAATKAFPSADWDNFVAMTKDALENC